MTEADGWAEVGRRIQKRIFEELQLSKAEFIRLSGISDKTLTGYLEGKPIVRRDKRRDLCRALSWTPDSLDLILDGDEPVEAVSKTEADPSYDQRLDRLERELVELRALLGLPPRRRNGGNQSRSA